MIDFDVQAIVAYLATAAGVAGAKWVDRHFDLALTSLTDLVSRKIGIQSVTQLQQNPDSVRSRNQMAEAIAREAATDEQFAHRLTEIQQKLDGLNGRAMIVAFDNSVSTVTLTGNTGMAAGKDINQHINNHVDVPSPDDMSRAPMWTRTLLWVGTVIAVIGWLTMMFSMQSSGHPADGATGFAVFAIGGVIAMFGQLGAQTSTPRRRR
ncbi:hypothetical protein ACFRAQ_12455 [Nocardia sp. NPDC056611]|uniref:hypothetical protein n=1 Tax=Nocardia sp. NPDC056611 TaxID=3345877 RepID=UPI00366C78FA